MIKTCERKKCYKGSYLILRNCKPFSMVDSFCFAKHEGTEEEKKKFDLLLEAKKMNSESIKEIHDPFIYSLIYLFD